MYRSIMCFVCLVGCLQTVPIEAQPVPSQAVKDAVFAFIDALNAMDIEREMSAFSEDATMFFPFSFTPNLLHGRAEIKTAQVQGFERIRRQLEQAGADKPYTLGLNPTDLHVQMLGPDVAVVNWHSHRPTNAGRRTAVLHKREGTWLIVSFHASNIAKST